MGRGWRRAWVPSGRLERQTCGPARTTALSTMHTDRIDETDSPNNSLASEDPPNSRHTRPTPEGRWSRSGETGARSCMPAANSSASRQADDHGEPIHDTSPSSHARGELQTSSLVRLLGLFRDRACHRGRSRPLGDSCQRVAQVLDHLRRGEIEAGGTCGEVSRLVGPYRPQSAMQSIPLSRVSVG